MEFYNSDFFITHFVKQDVYDAEILNFMIQMQF